MEDGRMQDALLNSGRMTNENGEQRNRVGKRVVS